MVRQGRRSESDRERPRGQAQPRPRCAAGRCRNRQLRSVDGRTGPPEGTLGTCCRQPTPENGAPFRIRLSDSPLVSLTDYDQQPNPFIWTQA